MYCTIFGYSRTGSYERTLHTNQSIPNQPQQSDSLVEISIQNKSIFSSRNAAQFRTFFLFPIFGKLSEFTVTSLVDSLWSLPTYRLQDLSLAAFTGFCNSKKGCTRSGMNSLPLDCLDPSK